MFSVRAFGIIGGGAALAFAGALSGIQFLGAGGLGLGGLGNYNYISLELTIICFYSQELLE